MSRDFSARQREVKERRQRRGKNDKERRKRGRAEKIGGREEGKEKIRGKNKGKEREKEKRRRNRRRFLYAFTMLRDARRLSSRVVLLSTAKRIAALPFIDRRPCLVIL